MILIRFTEAISSKKYNIYPNWIWTYCYSIETIDQVGEPLFLTQYINSGDIETGRSMAQVDWTLLQGEYKIISLIVYQWHMIVFFYKFSRSKVANGVPLATLLRVCISWNVNFLISHLIVFSSFFDWKLQNIALDIVINILNLMIFLEKPCLILL